MSLAKDVETVRGEIWATYSEDGRAVEADEALDRIETALVVSVEAALMVARATTREDE